MTESTEENQDFGAKYGKAVVRAWTDADYKAKLLGDPRAALAEVGIELPADMNVNVAEADAENMQLVLPPAPEGEIGDEALRVSAGVGLCSSGFCGTLCG